jgi:hypothetical protein
MTAAARTLGCSDRTPLGWAAAAHDFILEGLCALKRITRTDDGRLLGSAPATKAKPSAADRRFEEMLEADEDEPTPKGRKKYYN